MRLFTLYNTAILQQLKRLPWLRYRRVASVYTVYIDEKTNKEVQPIIDTINSYNSGLTHIPIYKERSYSKHYYLIIAISSLIGGYYIYKKRYAVIPSAAISDLTTNSTQESINKAELTRDLKLTSQEEFFISSANYLCRNVIYISPGAYIKMLTATNESDYSAISSGVRKIKSDLASKWLKNTPQKDSYKLFHKIWDNGLLSYADFKFLNSILTKPKRLFEIAFNIFDRDSDGHVDENEFIQVQSAILGKAPPLLDSRTNQIRSSLLIHFFGTDGKGTLSFNEFSNFINHFQKEVFKFEFNKYSKGTPSLAADVFVDLILCYNAVSTLNIKSRISAYYNNSVVPEFTLTDYEQFSQLLMNLEDFITVTNIYGKELSKKQFKHAVKIACDVEFNREMLNILFLIFDENGDGKLTFDEFIDVMLRRQKRAVMWSQSKYIQFKTCFKSQARAQK